MSDVKITRKMYATDGICIYKWLSDWGSYEDIKNEEIVNLLNSYYEKKLAWEQRGIKRDPLFNTIEFLVDTKREPKIWLDVLLFKLGFADNYGEATTLIRQGEVFIEGQRINKETQHIDVGEVTYKDITIQVGKTRKAILRLDKSYDPKNKSKLKIILITREELI